MVDIDPTHPFPHSILGRVQLTKGEYSKAIISFKKAVINSPDKLEFKEDTYLTLATIGLTEQAASFHKDSEEKELYYWYLGDINEYVSQSRAVYPSDEDDSLGLYFRAEKKGRAGNYSDAMKYYMQTPIGETSIERIYSFMQIGEIETALRLIGILQTDLSDLLDARFKYWSAQPIELLMMENAYLEGNIEKAILSLKQAMSEHYIIDYDYKVMPMFKKLREHPEWPIILKESERRAALQRELYRTLSAKDA